LASIRNGWYLVGWCHLRQAGRIFRLDRITSARLTRRPVAERDLDETLGWVPYETARP
jgi:predicted DNA-binding transcriptional regulator YafY